jgi:hypothetical protein
MKGLWRRPKDLAGSTWGLDQCRKASLATAETKILRSRANR